MTVIANADQKKMKSGRFKLEGLGAMSPMRKLIVAGVALVIFTSCAGFGGRDEMPEGSQSFFDVRTDFAEQGRYKNQDSDVEAQSINRLSRSLGRGLDILNGRHSCRIHSEQSEASCHSVFDRLRQKPKIRIGIHFGYFNSDTSDSVNDRIEFSAIVHMLERSCTAEIEPLCGFQFEGGSQEPTWVKVVHVGGVSKKIVIHAQYASLTTSDSMNNGPVKSSQDSLSRVAERSFLRSVTHDDVVIYDGHSRDGGGPDFKSPIRKQNRHVDYDYYHQHRVGIEKLLATLRDASRRPDVLALLSCSSQMHFCEPLENAAPRTTLLLSDAEVSGSTVMEALAVLLAGVIKGACVQDVSDALKIIARDAHKIHDGEFHFYRGAHSGASSSSLDRN